MKNKIIKKPWGQEEIIEHNQYYVVKKLTMYKGHKCSLQYHDFKHETIYILSGALRIFVGKDLKKNSNIESSLFYTGDSIILTPGVVHRMEAEEDSVYLEASTPQLEDVIRLEDDYERR